MLSPAISEVGLVGLVGDMGVLPFSVATAIISITERYCRRMVLTPIKMSLFSQVIFRVTIRIDRTIKLLEGHQRRNKLVVCMEKTAEIFLVVNVMNLQSSANLSGPLKVSGIITTYVSQNLTPQFLASFKSFSGKCVV